MAHVHEVTIWARGVVQDKEGRDVSQIIALGADKENKFTQAFDDYEDLPDRVGVPVRKYTRISDEEIVMRYDYENENPETVIVMDESIVKGINILRHMKQKGVLIVNTKRPAADILKFIPNKDLLDKIVCVDAEEIAAGATTVDFSGSEGGVDATSLGAGISAPLVGAALKATDLVALDSILDIVVNKEALKRGYEEAVIESVN
ncbi:MAG: 2-oxoacid:acceptor oxidoreductase family protein [Candidatus Desulfatibia sp.]|uniref:oxalate oxidoreductase subunit delta n=1 Tax=Candidatus Desulfatibia sp. TaxID=3101189 RepID=UPI002F32CCDC